MPETGGRTGAAYDGEMQTVSNGGPAGEKPGTADTAAREKPEEGKPEEGTASAPKQEEKQGAAATAGAEGESSAGSEENNGEARGQEVVQQGIQTKANGGQACPAQEETIRVLIKTQDFQGEYHESLSIVCNSATHTAGQGKVIAAGETLELDGGSELFGADDVIELIPEDETAGFTVTSLRRAQGTPTYEGKLEIRREAGGLLLINEVALETYLCYVVPSEMPASYEKEALKAQAVCARTYACRQILDGALEAKHADVDDSVSFQVYNNIERQERADEAVAETAGIIMTCDQEPITAYFFSTSSGHTSTNEVWAQTPEKYLQCVNLGDLESAEPWYRWSVSLPAAYLNGRISKYGIGDLTGFEVVKRSQGGAVEELKITGTEGETVLSSEYKIRQLLSTEGYPITRNDGSTVTDMSLMPSAYFDCTPVTQNGETTAWLFEGGGYGHGVGMSQNGANRLAEQGKGYEEILRYFYTEIDLCSVS